MLACYSPILLEPISCRVVAIPCHDMAYMSDHERNTVASGKQIHKALLCCYFLSC